MNEIIGELLLKKETFDEKEVHWKIPDFLSLRGLCYWDAPAFEFLNTHWFLQINPRDPESRITVQLRTDGEELSYNMLCTLGFQNFDGSRAGTRSSYHTFCDKKFKCITQFFCRNELLYRVPKLIMPSNVLTVICKLEHLDGPMHSTGNIKFIICKFCL